MSPDSTWLAALRDGDKVIIEYEGINAWRGVRTVRLTPTQIVVKSHHDTKALRFDRITGHLKGAFDYFSPSLLPYTEQAALKIRTAIAAATVCAKLGKVSHTQIEALAQEECADLYEALAHLQHLFVRQGLW